MKSSITFETDSDLTFPYKNRPITGTPNLTILNSETVKQQNIREGMKQASEFTADDFHVLGLSGRIPVKFGNDSALLRSAEVWEANASNRRPTATYLLSEVVFEKKVVGQVTYTKRRSRLLEQILEDRTRLITGWFNNDLLEASCRRGTHQSTEAFAVNSLRLAVAIAAASGIKEVELLVPELNEGRNKGLASVACSLDPSEHGFKSRGEAIDGNSQYIANSQLWTKVL